MASRTGTCTACKASVQIDDTLNAANLKCSKCGAVVKLDPLTAGSGKPELRSLPAQAAAAPAGGAAGKPAPRPSTPSSGASKSAAAKPAARAGAGARKGVAAPAAPKKKLDPKIVAVGLVVFVLIDIGIYLAWQNSNNVEAKKPEATAPEAAKPDATKPEAAKVDPSKPAAPAPTAPASTEFPPPAGTTPQRWAEIQKYVAILADGSDKAAIADADYEVKLTPNLNVSMPAVLNLTKKLDLNIEADFRKADTMRQVLEYICPAVTIEWKNRGEQGWLAADQKAVKDWSDVWTKASTDKAYWKQVTNVGATPVAPANPEPPKKSDH